MSGSNNHRRRISQKKRQEQIIQRVLIVGIGIFIIILAIVGYRAVFHGSSEAVSKNGESEIFEESGETNPIPKPDIDVQLLTVNEFSRPGTPTDKITGIVVHYLANPGSTAQDNRDYFESLKDVQDNYISSNFVIGPSGEIVQCVPTAEVAYASNSRNHDTVSIECGHPDETGKFTEPTYQSLVELVAWLCGKFDLTTDGIIRHYDVTGKECPKYFVENEDEWIKFKQDVADYMEKYQ